MAGYRKPRSPADIVARDAARAEKLDALHQRLHDQVSALRSGADWQRMLTVAARFHDYSLNNVLLILAQRPDATRVAGYHTWRDLDRQVTKGEHGIAIIAPIMRRTDAGDSGAEPTPVDSSARASTSPATAPDDGQQRDRPRAPAGFRLVHVFDISQTEGEPLADPAAPATLNRDAPAGAWQALAVQVEAAGFTLERGDCGDAGGVTEWGSRVVRVAGDQVDAQSVYVLGHELAHIKLHDRTRDGVSPHRGIREVEADSVAYLVATSFGIDADTASFPYVTGWAASVDGAEPEQVVRLTAERVLGCARSILNPATTAPVPPELAAAAQSGVAATAALRDRATTASKFRDQHQPASAHVAAVTTTRPVEDLDRLLSLHTAAAAFYTTQLHTRHGDGPHAGLQHLQERRIPLPVLEQYGIGYAPPGWTALTEHLRALGYTDRELLAAGVASRTTRGSLIDRFRDRVMFPVPEQSGQVIAFIGRTLAAVTDRNPKYLNSPETLLYRKSEVLYGLHHATAQLAAGARPVLVEGLWDAIAVNYAGVGRYVGVTGCGTALTREHVAALRATTRRDPIAAFDADAGGRNATLRAFPLLRQAGYWPRAATFPDGHDPASLLRDGGPVALNEVLYAAAARPLADLVVDERLDKFEDPLQFDETRLLAARSAAFVIADLPAEHVGRQVARIAGALDLDTAEVTAYVAEAVTRIADARSAASRRATARSSASPVPDRAEFPTPVTSAAIAYPTTSRPTGAQHATAAVSASARSHHAVSA